MNFKYVVLILLTIIFGYLLKMELTCTNYNGNFHYSSYASTFHLKELIITESNTPIIVVRIFHNKFTVFFFYIFERFIQFFDIFYLIKIMGLAGLFGLFYFYFSLFTQKTENKLIKLFGITILFLPFLEIFQLTKQAFFLKILIFIIPYQIAAFIGSVFFIKEKKSISYGIYFLLLILSVGWIIIFNNDVLSFCTTK